jgi:thiosulfate dehydrogenase
MEQSNSCIFVVSKKNTMEEKKIFNPGFQLFTGLILIFALSATLLFIGFLSYEMTHQPNNPALASQSSKKNYGGGSRYIASSSNTYSNLWKAPDINSLTKDAQGDEIRYGRELVAQTAKYLGPKGSVAQISNGLNCQNCHLEAGTAAFGNNYGGVAATYPQVRPRGEKMVDIPQRINSCFQRSLNGQPLPLNSKELKAMTAYIEWLGKDVPKGVAPEGAGLLPLAYLNRAADPSKGKGIYDGQCARCHGNQGEGKLFSDAISYEYPPLWGANSYNVSAGLYRVEKFARYIKANMPFGVTYNSPTLSDEEAWDIAAFVNAQPHPDKRFAGDWPNLLTKAIDAPFGPYADPFSEEQHKYGPYPPIIAEIKKLKSKK